MTLGLLHPAWMLALAAAAWLSRDPRIAALGGAASLVLFALRSAGRWTPGGRFGAANAVTALRLALVLVLSALDAGPRAAALLSLVLALDGLDGALARRRGLVSPFGATFDMETDALLVLVAGLVLGTGTPGFGFMVLPGLLRYVYAVAIRVVPSRGEAPRSALGRYAFFMLVVALVTGLLPLHGARGLSLLAAALVGLSFARSFYWSFTGIVPHGAPSGRSAP